MASDFPQDIKRSDSQDDGMTVSTEPRFQEREHNPGLEVLSPSDLEVVAPRQNLSQNKTWESTSALPEATLAPGAATPGYPHTNEYMSSPMTAYSSVAPAYDYQATPFEQPPPNGKDGRDIFHRERICGVRRQIFWALIALGVFLLVAAVAIGVGLGVGLNKNDSSSSSR
jgi:hypothetical protein